MTKISDHEDFIFQSPERVDADILEGQRAGIWLPLAKKLGWSWEPAYGGFINEAHPRHSSLGGGYEVAETSEDACFMSGFETPEEAIKKLEE